MRRFYQAGENQKLWDCMNAIILQLLLYQTYQRSGITCLVARDAIQTIARYVVLLLIIIFHLTCMDHIWTMSLCVSPVPMLDSVFALTGKSMVVVYVVNNKVLRYRSLTAEINIYSGIPKGFQHSRVGTRNLKYIYLARPWKQIST